MGLEAKTEAYHGLFEHSNSIVDESKVAMEALDLEFAHGQIKTLLRCIMIADNGVPEELLLMVDIRSIILNALLAALKRMKATAKIVRPEDHGYEASHKSFANMISTVEVMRGGFSVYGTTP